MQLSTAQPMASTHQISILPCNSSQQSPQRMPECGTSTQVEPTSVTGHEGRCRSVLLTAGASYLNTSCRSARTAGCAPPGTAAATRAAATAPPACTSHTRVHDGSHPSSDPHMPATPTHNGTTMYPVRHAAPSPGGTLQQYSCTPRPQQRHMYYTAFPR